MPIPASSSSVISCHDVWPVVFGARPTDNREVNTPGNSGRDDREPIRILPADIRSPTQAALPEDQSPRRWRPLAAGAAVVALAALVVTTAPDRTEQPTPPVTQPRSLAAIQPAEIDLTKTHDGQAVAQWTRRELDSRQIIADIGVVADQMLALGSEQSVAQIWRSRSGLAWSPATHIDAPNPSAPTISLITTALPWGEEILAFGPIGGQGLGVWASTTTGTWALRTTVEGFSIDRPFAVAANDDLILAVARAGDGYAGWTSPDGIEWASRGYLPDLNELEGGVLRAARGWFYMLGSADCDGAPCPAIFGSADGITWQPTDVATVPDQPEGMVADLTATGSGLVAIGAGVTEAGARPLLWRSTDGSSWDLLPTGDAFGSHVATVELTGISPETPRQATIVVSGLEQTVVEGSVVVTDGGRTVISSVYQDSVGVSIDGIRTRLDLDNPATLTRRPELSAITAQGSRLLIAGQYVTSVDPGSVPRPGPTSVAAAWVSADGGVTWDSPMLDNAGGTSATAAALLGDNLAVAGGGPRGGLVWHTTWDTATEETDAIAAAVSFLDAVTAGDTETVLTDLASRNDSPLAQLPGLGGVGLPWWSPDTGDLDSHAVTDTLAYSAEMHTVIEAADCSARVEVDVLDSARVFCSFTVASDLTRTVGVTMAQGRIAVTIGSDGVNSLQVLESASLPMWRSLASWASSTSSDAGKTLGVMGHDGTWDVNPVFTGQAAAAQLEAANEYAADVLSPGGVRAGDTSMGRMEWQWLTELPDGAASIGLVAYTDLGFVAIGSSTPNGRAGTLWSSQDGLSWTALPPSPLDSIGTVSAYPGGVLATGPIGPSDVVAIFTGTDWTTIRLPNTSAPQHAVYSAASTADRTVVIRLEQIWNEDVLYIPQVWVLDATGTLEQGTFPGAGDGNAFPQGLVATDNGFLLATIGLPGLNAGAPMLHSSSDGLDWTELPNPFPTEGASLGGLTRVADRYVVTAGGEDMYCFETEGGTGCYQISVVWSSVDGETWTQAFVAEGDPVTGRAVGGGDLGAFVIDEPPGDYNAPRAVFLSSEGVNWERLASPLLLDPEATFTWFVPPAVGTDTVVIATSSDHGTAEALQNSLIVGHLIEP